MKPEIKKFIKIFSISLGVGVLFLAIVFLGMIFGLWGGIDDLDIDSLVLNQNSVILYVDSQTGEEKELAQISASENRVWADIEDIPVNLQTAFIAIEDERFMQHNGFDLLRTTKATFTYLGNKIIGRDDIAFGGSTITQQLIKNITGERDQTPIRKIREISRAISLEKNMEKTDILELYLNCIYLANGCNGVQTASKVYFDKDVSELTLAECASIAGITKNPSAYDPLNNPNNNRERRKLVLSKMLELGYISQQEYDSAVAEEIVVAKKSSAATERGTTSYFVDQVISEVSKALQEKGYSETLANNLIYSGGLKIYSTCNPDVQDAVEKYYSNEKNFKTGVQSAITVVDVETGGIVGIAGGVGKKTGSLTLNRASQSPRQPGSTIKPLAAYAPAIERGVITPADIYQDVAKSYGGWTPRNYDYSYRGPVDIRTAVRRSLNTIPVSIINEMGAQVSYDFLTNNLGFTTLVESREIDGKIYSDIGLSQLALGGLTDGMTTMEMAAAYASFANGGIYHRPHSYTKVCDKEGNVILENDVPAIVAMKSSTAYIMTQMLKEVVSSGTGAGATVSRANYTAGKTGTTSENNDRWFAGYTPYYSAAIWYGYDTPQEIYVSGNPCIPAFRSIMNDAHSKLSDTSKGMSRPSDVISVSYCVTTGCRASETCPETDTYYFASGNLPGYCTSEHLEEKTEEGEEGAEGEGNETDAEGEDIPDAPLNSGETASQIVTPTE